MDQSPTSKARLAIFAPNRRTLEATKLDYIPPMQVPQYLDFRTKGTTLSHSHHNLKQEFE
jgi:hypothetical protein